MSSDELDFDAPRHSTARIPIFCQLCRKQGRIAYRKDDNPRYGGGHYTGPTMRLVDYAAGLPRICRQCAETMEVFE